MKITTKTLISLPIVLAFIGGVLWLSSIDATAKVNSKEIKEHKNFASKVYDKLGEMNERLSRIEGRLEVNR